MVNKKTYYLAAIVFFVFFITSLHHLIPQKQSPDIVLEELYYIPILFGALFLGLKGALLIYLFASLSYLPFFSGTWTVTFFDLINRLLHFLFTGVFAFLSGFLVERTRRLERQAEKERYLANIGQVATTIVHDLKNPLIVILGFSKRIRDGKGNISGAAQKIIESAENMQKIVYDVLDFSKPIKLELKEEDLGSIVRKACDYCKSKAEKRDVSLSTNIPNHPVDILIDSFALQRALVNLLNNGIEASDRGQAVTVSVETGARYHTIRIKDVSSGMDKETLENIFIPFYTRKRGGTGLGMAIAKKVIEGHKGRINVDSKVGKGTAIVIALPLKEG